MGGTQRVRPGFLGRRGGKGGRGKKGNADGAFRATGGPDVSCVHAIPVEARKRRGRKEKGVDCVTRAALMLAVRSTSDRAPPGRGKRGGEKGSRGPDRSIHTVPFLSLLIAYGRKKKKKKNREEKPLSALQQFSPSSVRNPSINNNSFFSSASPESKEEEKGEKEEAVISGPAPRVLASAVLTPTDTSPCASAMSFKGGGK